MATTTCPRCRQRLHVPRESEGAERIICTSCGRKLALRRKLPPEATPAAAIERLGKLVPKRKDSPETTPADAPTPSPGTARDTRQEAAPPGRSAGGWKPSAGPLPKVKYFSLAAVVAGIGVYVSFSNLLYGFGTLSGHTDGGVAFDGSLSLVSATFAGLFTAAVANRYQIKHSLYAGLAIFVYQLLVLPVHLFVRYGKQGLLDQLPLDQAWQLLLRDVLSPPVLAMLAAIFPGAVLGGLLDRAMMGVARRLTPPRQWTYTTAAGQKIPVFDAWRHPVLSWFWFLCAIGFFVTCWAHLADDPKEGARGIWPAIVIGFVCLIVSHKRWAKSACVVLRKERRPLVVYLRSFTHDGRRSHEGTWYELTNGINAIRAQTMEQCLARATSRTGLFLALGKPGEELPEFGALRMYVSHDDWQELVLDLLGKPGSVVLFQAGESPSLRWELSQVVSRLDPEKVLVFVPKPRSEKLYAAFRTWGQECFQAPLPEQIGRAHFLYFEPGWKPRVLDWSAELPPKHPLLPLLKALRTDKQLGTPQPYSWAFTVFVTVLAVLGLVLGGLLLWSFIANARNRPPAPPPVKEPSVPEEPIPDDLGERKVYEGRAVAYRIRLGPDWQEQPVTDKPDRLFKHGNVDLRIIAAPDLENLKDFPQTYVKDLSKSFESVSLLESRKVRLRGRPWIDFRVAIVSNGRSFWQHLRCYSGLDGTVMLLAGFPEDDEKTRELVRLAFNGIELPEPRR